MKTPFSPRHNSLRRLFIFLYFFAVAVSARATLDPTEYDRWQKFNNWPIRALEFPGIHNFSRSELLAVLATEQPSWLRRYARLGHRTIFFADDFAADVLRLSRFYQREGFPEADVTGRVIADEQRRELRLQFEVVEAAPLRISGWNFDRTQMGSAHIDSLRWTRSMNIHVGGRLASSAISAAADTIAHELRKSGYARASVTTDVRVDTLSSAGFVTFTPIPGSYCLLGQTRIVGLKQVSEGTARRELAYQEWDPYSPKKLDITRRNLVRLETFRFVGVRADTAVAGDTLPVFVSVEEGNRYRMRFGFGYNYPQLALADAEFKDLNFFGRGRRFTLNAGASIRLREVSARLFWPHMPWNRTDLTFMPAWRLRDEELGRFEEQLATTIFSFSPTTTTRLSLSNEVGRKIQLDAPDSADASYFSSLETFSFGWDTRDNPLIPRRGHFVAVTVQESGAAYKTDRRWWKALLQTRLAIPDGKHRVIAGKLECGVMGPLFDDEATPQDVRFALGGPSTIRGWGFQRLSPRAPLDPDVVIGGDAMLNVTAEVRQNVWGPVTLALFADAANVWESREQISPFNLFPTTGGGLLFLTPVGPLRVDLATQLRLSGQPNSIQVISVSFGTPF